VSIKIAIYDGATPVLDRIAQLSTLSALAALDQAGMVIRDRTRDAFKASKRSQWSVKVVNGKRVWTRSGNTHEFGKRFNFKKAGPESMANMINSYLMGAHLTMVVGGMHKSFLARLYYQEAKSNFEGGAQFASKKTGQVLHGSWQILKKLDTGGRFSSLDPKYRATRQGEDTKPMGKDPQYQRRNFFQKGRDASMGEVKDIMTKKLESLIYKQVNRANVKTKVRVS